VLDACREIHALCKPVSLSEFEQQRLRHLSVERLFEIGGEAMNRAVRRDPEVIEIIPTASALIGLRNRVAHGYDTIRLDILWDTGLNDLPVLIREIEELLIEHGFEPGDGS